MQWRSIPTVATACCLLLSTSPIEAQTRSSSLAAPPSPLRPVSAGQIRLQNEQAAAQFAKGQLPVPPDGVEVELPESPAEVIFTNGGWRLAMLFSGIGKIGIFNLSTLKFDGDIPITEPGVMIASGGTLLATYTPSSRLLQVYDLNTLQKRASKVLDWEGTLAGMTMALYQPMQIIAMVDKGQSEKFAVNLIRLPGFEVSTPEVYQDKDHYRSFRARQPELAMAANESGSCFYARFKKDSGSSVGCFHFQPDDRILLRLPLASFNSARPDRTGKYIVAHYGIFKSDNPDQSHADRIDIKPMGLATPVMGHDSFVTTLTSSTADKTTAGFRVISFENFKPLLDLPVIDEPAFWKLPTTPYPNQPGGAGDILAAATSYRIIYTGSSWNKMRIYALGRQR